MRFLPLLLLLPLLAACAKAPYKDPLSPEARTASLDLDRRYERIASYVRRNNLQSDGGQEVLRVAYEALRQRHLAGERLNVGLEDLWTHALQEGEILFNHPDRRWGKTTAAQTSDMLGQTTVGPWQLTLDNIRNEYGKPYNIDPEWTNAQLNDWLRARPNIQALMIIDYIDKSYRTLGRRGPYAIQRYFWLEPFVRNEIGQGDWRLSPVAKSPTGKWQDLTPELKRNTGFYAKQILLGSSHNHFGLLFWLAVTGDTPAIDATLQRWRDQPRLQYVGEQLAPTPLPGNFLPAPEDVVYPPTGHEPIRQSIRAAIQRAAAPPPK